MENQDENIDYNMLYELTPDELSSFMGYIESHLDSDKKIFYSELHNILVRSGELSEETLKMILRAMHQENIEVLNDETPINYHILNNFLRDEDGVNVSILDKSVEPSNIEKGDMDIFQQFEEEAGLVEKLIQVTSSDLQRNLKGSLRSIRSLFDELKNNNFSLREKVTNLEFNNRRKETIYTQNASFMNPEKSDDLYLIQMKLDTLENRVKTLTETVERKEILIDNQSEELLEKEKQLNKKEEALSSLEAQLQEIMSAREKPNEPGNDKVKEFENLLFIKDNRIADLQTEIEATRRREAQKSVMIKELEKELNAANSEFNRLLELYEQQNTKEELTPPKLKLNNSYIQPKLDCSVAEERVTTNRSVLDKSVEENAQPGKNLGALLQDDSKLDFKDNSILESNPTFVKVGKFRESTLNKIVSVRESVVDSKENSNAGDAIEESKIDENLNESATFKGHSRVGSANFASVKGSNARHSRELSMHNILPRNSLASSIANRLSFSGGKATPGFKTSDKMIVHEKQLTFGNNQAFIEAANQEEVKKPVNPFLLLSPDDLLIPSNRTRRSDISPLQHTDNTLFLSMDNKMNEESQIKHSRSNEAKSSKSNTESKLKRLASLKAQSEAEMQKKIQYLLDQQAVVFKTNYNKMEVAYKRQIEVLNNNLDRHKEFHNQNKKFHKTCSNCSKSPIFDDCYCCLVCDNYFLCNTCQRLHNHVTIKLNHSDHGETSNIAFHLSGFMANAYGNTLFEKILEAKDNRKASFFGGMFKSDEYFVEIKIEEGVSLKSKETKKLKLSLRNTGSKTFPAGTMVQGKNFKNMYAKPQKILFNFSPGCKVDISIEVQSEFDFKGSYFEAVCSSNSEVINSQSNKVFIKPKNSFRSTTIV